MIKSIEEQIQAVADALNDCEGELRKIEMIQSQTILDADGYEKHLHERRLGLRAVLMTLESVKNIRSSLIELGNGKIL